MIDETDDTKVIDSTCYFRLKCFQYGLMKILRIVFVPMVINSWKVLIYPKKTPRLCNVLSLIKFLIHKCYWNWSQIEVVLHLDLYMQMWKRVRIFCRNSKTCLKKVKVLKLSKTLYPLQQSLLDFWKYLNNKLSMCGFEKSKFDMCLFIGGEVIFIVFCRWLTFFLHGAKLIFMILIWYYVKKESIKNKRITSLDS